LETGNTNVISSRLIIPPHGISIPGRMAVVPFLGVLFSRPANYMPKKNLKSSKCNTPGEKALNI
jgi:hypothetical protein